MFKQKFYSLKTILSKDAQYNIIFGERSNGKTYSVLKYGLEKFCKTGEQTAIVRRWSEDFKGKRGATMYQSLVNNHEIEKGYQAVTVNAKTFREKAEGFCIVAEAYYLQKYFFH